MTIKPGPPSRRSHMPLLLRMSPITPGFATFLGLLEAALGKDAADKNETCARRELLVEAASNV